MPQSWTDVYSLMQNFDDSNNFCLLMIQFFWKSMLRRKIPYLCFLRYIICVSKVMNWILNKAININATKLGIFNAIALLHPSSWQVSQNVIWTFAGIFACIHLLGFSSAYSQEHDREMTVLSPTKNVMNCSNNPKFILYPYLNASFSYKLDEACFRILNYLQIMYIQHISTVYVYVLHW